MARRYIVDEENARGSAFLKAQYTEAELTLLIGVGERLGIKLTDFFPYGVPAFDGASGTWRVTPEQLPDLIRELTQLEKIPNLKVFPKGLPALEAFDVVFEAGSRRTP
jgi:hypothetical protein